MEEKSSSGALVRMKCLRIIHSSSNNNFRKKGCLNSFSIISMLGFVLISKWIFFSMMSFAEKINRCSDSSINDWSIF